MQKVEYLPDGGIEITNTIEFPKWFKEKLEGMAYEEAEALLDRIKSEIKSKLAKAMKDDFEDAILGSWCMPHSTDLFSEPPFTPERYTYDGLGEYGKDWIHLDNTPILKIKEHKCK